MSSTMRFQWSLNCPIWRPWWWQYCLWSEGVDVQIFINNCLLDRFWRLLLVGIRGMLLLKAFHGRWFSWHLSGPFGSYGRIFVLGILALFLAVLIGRRIIIRGHWWLRCIVEGVGVMGWHWLLLDPLRFGSTEKCHREEDFVLWWVSALFIRVVKRTLFVWNARTGEWGPGSQSISNFEGNLQQILVRILNDIDLKWTDIDDAVTRSIYQLLGHYEYWSSLFDQASWMVILF